MKKIAMILSGCGYIDGSEITETVSLMVALHQKGAHVEYFTLDSLMNECALITRGKIKPLKDLQASQFDALVLPGGYGAATQLSTWKNEGAQCQVSPEVLRCVNEFYDQAKPIGAACIAPVILAKALGDNELTLTLGAESEAAKEMEKTGAVHEICAVDDYITDRAHRVITSPAYMYDEAQPDQVFKGLQGLVSELMEMA